MNEWIVPLTGFLVFLLFCSGCFVRVWRHNRKIESGHREVTSTGNTLSENYFCLPVDLP